jgi:hypothetical protein
VTTGGILLTGARGMQDGKQVADAFTIFDGNAIVVTNGETMSFDVVVRGYVAEHFAGPVADVTLRLQPQAPVRVQIEGLRSLPDGCRATFHASDVDLVRLLVRSEGRFGYGAGLLNTFQCELDRDAGKITPCRTCRLQCELMLSPSQDVVDRMETLPLGEVSWVPGQERIALSVDPEALRGALTRLR